jgi:hypothetical protein
VTPVELFLTIVAGMTAVWVALYTTCLVWLWRQYLCFTRRKSKRIGSAWRKRTWAASGEAIEATLAIAWSTGFVLALAPLFLVFVPLCLTIAALIVTGQLITVQK